MLAPTELEQLVQSGGYIHRADNERLASDVEAVLLSHGIVFKREPLFGALRADFLLEVRSGQAAQEKRNGRLIDAGRQIDAERGGKEECGGQCYRFALECRHPAAGGYTVLLGHAVMLQQVTEVDGVLLCVPYLSAFDPVVLGVFVRQRIRVATPDNLPDVLQEMLREVSGQQTAVFA